MKRGCSSVLLVLSISAQAVTLETVRVGDVGNIADVTGYGSVGYGYNIGKYEVTAGQYTDFLNAVAKTDTYGLYNSEMWSYLLGCRIQQTGSSGNFSYTVADDYANRPVNYVSFWDACRFANWLGNGQGNGATETGAYTLDSYNGTDGHNIHRNAGATWAVASENEWYKAAYYDPNKAGGAGYWLYPTSSNTAPGRDIADVSGNSANYYINGYSIGSPYYRTNVGAFQNSDSPYGTFDQGGNVWEWSEAINRTVSFRLRGGSFYHNPFYSGSDGYAFFLQALCRYNSYNPTDENCSFGFRVSEVQYAPSVPEPDAMSVLLSGLATAGIMFRRHRV